MRRLLSFLSNMDAQAWRTVLISFVLFGGVGLVFVFGAQLLGIDSARELEHWLTAARGPWSLPVAVAAFAALAFIGTPQIVLIAAAVVAFGPYLGAAYSWIGTLVSSLVGFYVGRGAGARVLARFSGDGLRRFMRLVGENGFLASLIVRLVPSAPFIVVNMAFGAARANYWAYVAGCALGVLPKTALVAFFGGAVVSAVSGDGVWTSLILAGVAVVWLGLMLAVREFVKRREQDADAPGRG